MKGNARPSFFDPTAAFDDPLEMLLLCHRRIEKQLATLERLRVHVKSHGVDADASLAAQNVLRYFTGAAVNHHEDEENDLFPLLERRISEPEAAGRFRALREMLESEHRLVESYWARLKRPLEGIADGFTRALPENEVRAFTEAYESHIRVEEEALQEFFGRWIDADDRAALGKSMSARRRAA
jgi:hemerythrin-like domain-containing protein